MKFLFIRGSASAFPTNLTQSLANLPKEAIIISTHHLVDSGGNYSLLLLYRTSL